ncbi:GAF domain-containing protein [Oenococcus alcoholitolerans]|uniref:GAF domain-containing protein n=1 Tax=Oenococcus alcoholitolerans TaxID=931074 RepID=UPI003F71EBA4
MTKNNIEADQLLSQIFLAAHEKETDRIANLANASAVLKQFVNDINWAGFYLFDRQSGQLVLGPFQGLPATSRIDLDKGVVGKGFSTQKTVFVDDVNNFSGHIVCDPASRSEIVIPLTKTDGQKIGVLDIDAPITARFDEQTRADLEAFAKLLLDYI